MRVETGFQPTPFTETNAYTHDPVLPSLLKRLMAQEVYEEVSDDLIRLGREVVTTLRTLSDSGGKVANPKLVQYDQWGKRIDDLQTSEAWRELKAFSQREGLPAIFYERKYKEQSRIYGFAKALLMAGDNHYIFCPISMTDGCARVIELLGSHEMKKDILPRLISRDPSVAFTSGQWMTERPGGSDVSMTETVAQPTGEISKYGSKYTIDGFKWFSSATDSDVAVALARTGTLQEGSRGLSLFLLPLRLPLLRNPFDPVPPAITNNIYIHRLKNKIGNQMVPTAELNLEGSDGYLIGDLGKGVKNITPVLNITRVWSSIGSIGNLRKCLAIASSYAEVRSIQGGRTLLKDTPIHVETLASINVLYRALAHLVFGAIGLLGKAECNSATEDELRRLRMLTPLVKAYAAEKACAGMEEAMCALGGAGYMEENGFGRAIKDSLVEKIWEGTVVVLALDLGRAAQDPPVMTSYTSWANSVLGSCPAQLRTELSEPLALLKRAVLEFAPSYKQPIPPLSPRPALMVAGAITSCIYLLEHAVWSFNAKEPSMDVDLEIFERWVEESNLRGNLEALHKARAAPTRRIALNAKIVYGGSGIKTKL